MTVITNPAELRRRGLEVLVRELGFVNAMRFMLQSETGYGDYTREREQILPQWTIEDVIRQADAMISKG